MCRLPKSIEQSFSKLMFLPAGSTWYLLCHDELNDDQHYRQQFALDQHSRQQLAIDQYMLNIGDDKCSVHNSLMTVQHCLPYIL